MAITPTPRFGLKIYTSGADAHPNRAEFNAAQQLIEDNAVMGGQGTAATKPAAGKSMRVFRESDTGRVYWDTGNAWAEISTNGGGGAGSEVIPGANPAEGTSTRSARADHTHTIALATGAVDGAMAKADKAKLDAATAAASASALMARDANGRTKVADPAAAGDAATKGYVDTQVGTRALTAHTHAAADVASGTLDPARLPAVTQQAQGAMSAADKAKLDAATSAATPGALVMLDGSGRTRFADPAVAADAATKGYVDNGLGTKAAAVHSHAWADITSGVPATFAPSAHTHSAADITTGTLDPARLPAASGNASGTMSAADKAKLDAATSAATASALVARDASGRAKFADPAVAADAATKGYTDTGLGTKANTAHVHAWADITSGVPATFPSDWSTLGSKPALFPTDWSNVASKPATFAPSAHTHPWSDITGTPATYPPTIGTTATTAKAGNYVPAWAEVTGKPATFAPTIGTTAGTAKAGNYVPDWSELTNVPATFAPTIGTTAGTAKSGDWVPAWTDVTGKPATFAPSAHTHPWSDLTGVPATFAPIVGTTAATAKAGNWVPAWTDVTSKPATFAPSAHTHAWADITSGVPATFTPSAHTHSATDITSGVLDPARLPVANPAANGAMSPAFVNMLNDATAAATGKTLMLRNSDGTVNVGTPTIAAQATTKAYVDSGLGAKLNITSFSDRIGSGSTFTQIHSANKLGVMNFYDSGIVQATGIYSNNVGDSSACRAVWVDSGGYIGYNLSSARYKTNISSYEVPLDVLAAVEPKRFQYKSGIEKVGAENAPWRVNFLAEDLHDAGLTEYVSYDGEGTGRENVETINEQLMVNALWSFARQQQDLIETLTKKVAKLEGKAV